MAFHALNHSNVYLIDIKIITAYTEIRYSNTHLNEGDVDNNDK